MRSDEDNSLKEELKSMNNKNGRKSRVSDEYKNFHSRKSNYKKRTKSYNATSGMLSPFSIDNGAALVNNQEKFKAMMASKEADAPDIVKVYNTYLANEETNLPAAQDDNTKIEMLTSMKQPSKKAKSQITACETND